tara:strand:- start:180 stop:1028 length:849 start_codon:yes stop_codon:yes gene_type:complete
MILWLASYPKSGNTWLRCLLSSYYYTRNGDFDFSLLDNISQFPTEKIFSKYKSNIKKPFDTAKYWLTEQERINTNNKLIFLKTHCALATINNFKFTNSKNSIGAIYIIRDPRNLISSLKNHFQLSFEESYEFLINKRNSLSKIHENKNSLYYQPLGSWDFHVNSWIKTKDFPVLKIKYEDLINSTYETFKNIIQFINKISNLNKGFDRIKSINCIKNTNFEKLKKLEEDKGFGEARLNKKTGEKIKFFYLGSKNKYKDILDDNLIKKINKSFKNELISNNYL